jgi:hypothetical protein
MTTPTIPIEPLHPLHQPSAHWVQMKITNQLQKIGILFADNGFIAVLEKMAAPLVTTVKTNRIPC